MHTFEEENTCVDPLEEVARKGPQQPLSPFGKLRLLINSALL